jgi:crossover junction endodeoxyribonuclease RuvC
MIFVGIDPGLDGGLAALTPEGLALQVMPVVKVLKGRQLDEQAIVQWLAPFVPRACAYIELVHAMPKQGVVSMFTFGTGWGLVRGICAGMGLPYELVRPQEWQAAMLKGQPPGSEYLVASRLWPNAEWRATERCAKAHSGLVDAALIAEYGRRRST